MTVFVLTNQEGVASCNSCLLATESVIFIIIGRFRVVHFPTWSRKAAPIGLIFPRDREKRLPLVHNPTSDILQIGREQMQDISKYVW